MRRESLAAFTVTLLVLVAGCSSVLQDRTAPVDREPYDVPAQRDTTEARTPIPPGSGDLAPGLQSHRIRDPDALADAHRSVLANESFHVHYNEIVYGENGTIVQGVNLQATVERNRSRFTASIDDVVDDIGYPEAYDDLRYWSGGNGSPVIEATHERGQQPNYSVATGAGGGPATVADALGDSPSYANRLHQLLRATQEIRVSPTGNPGSYIVRVETVSDRVSIDRVGNGTVSDVVIVFFVNERGLLNEFYLSYRTSYDGERVRVIEQFRFIDIGGRRVYDPVWKNEALEAIRGGNQSTGGGSNGTTDGNESDARTGDGAIDEMRR